MDHIDQFVVLGAGASHGAREGLERRPPLGKDLAKYLLAWLDANKPPTGLDRVSMGSPRGDHPPPDLFDETDVNRRLRDFLREAQRRGEVEPHGFEQAAARLFEENHNRSEILEKLNRLIAFAMLMGRQCAFEESPDGDGYDELLGLPRFGANVAFIALNYDLLLDEALTRAKRDWDYPGLPRLNGTATGEPLFKIHGSVSWKRHYHVPGSANPDIARSNGVNGQRISNSGPDNGLETGAEEVRWDRRGTIWILKADRSDAPPVLATYDPGKRVDSNFLRIQDCNTRCLQAIARNPQADVTIIGLHLPPRADDPRLDAVLDALRRLQGEKEYVAPDDADRRTAKERGFGPSARTLREFLHIAGE